MKAASAELITTGIWIAREKKRFTGHSFLMWLLRKNVFQNSCFQIPVFV